jgi:transcription elongation factor Elf1
MIDKCPRCGMDALESIQVIMYRDAVQVDNDVSIHCRKCGLMLVEREKKLVPAVPPLPSKV